MVFYRKFCKFFYLLAGLTLLLLPLTAARAEGETLRVLLSIGSNKTFTIHLTGDFLCQGQTLTDGTLTCSVAQKGVRLSHSAAGRLDSDEEIVLQPLSPNSTFTLKNRYYGEQVYAGVLRLSRTPKGNVRVVNEVSIEEYQYGVLLGELSPNAPAEGAKALAIAARGLALNSLGSNARYDISDAGDNPDYYGTGQPEIPAFREAVSLVSGQTLTYHNAPVNTYYCRGNGGRTRLPEQIWKTEADPAYTISYDPADLAADPGAQTLLITGAIDGLPEEVSAFLLDQARILLPEAEGIGSITRFSEDGENSLPGKTCPVLAQLNVLVEGTVQPLTLSLDLSALSQLLGAGDYDICYVQQEARGALIVFSTLDGHGVGLSRRGLLTMVEQGLDYRQILSFYYPGARLEGGNQTIIAEPLDTPTPAPVQTTAPVAEASFLPGDVDEDGALTKGDISLLTRYVLGFSTFSHQQHKAADANGDGDINFSDVLALQDQVG